MKVKVLKTFGYKRLYEAGQIIEITKAEEEYINSSKAGLLVEVLKEDTVDLNSITKRELIEMAEEKGLELDSKLTKAEIIKRLEG
jgi:hypothetical protein